MKKKLFFITLLFLILLIVNFGCKKYGCTDSKALNNNFKAKKDDGTCEYSSVAFYASASFFQNIPITKVEVTVNSNSLGFTNAFYPNGPGNCSAPGIVSYKFANGKQVDWGAKIILANGAILLSNGTLSPSSTAPCLQVNVTR